MPTIRPVILASFVGTTIDWYDFFLYGTAAELVFGRPFFPNANPLVGTRSPESARPSAKRNETLLHCVRLPISDFRLPTSDFDRRVTMLSRRSVLRLAGTAAGAAFAARHHGIDEVAAATAAVESRSPEEVAA